MNMIVCVKQVVDPEAPPASFKIDPEGKKVLPPPGVPQVISPFDEQAVEAALKIKDDQGGKITIISLGTNLLRDVVKKPLAMGADELVLLEDDVFSDGDSWSTAHALAMAIKKIGEYDIIFCGRQAADWDAGQVGLGIAEILGLPSINVVKRIDVADSKATIEKVTEDGYEIIEVLLPVLVTVGSEVGEPRYPTIKGIMAAKKKEPLVWKPSDIGLDEAQVGASGRRTKLIKLYQPEREEQCEIIAGESPQEAAVNLAVKLKENKVI